LNEYTALDWSNGKKCPQHDKPFCNDCYVAVMSTEREKALGALRDANQEAFDALRTNIINRIMGRVNDSPSGQEFYRPRTRNFFQDSRRKQFAASCQLDDTFLVVPIEFIMIGDEGTVHRADDTEARAILTKEHMWDTSTPEWMQQNTTLQLDDEDNVLLREFQLFKS
jgi:hypothetical protein